jgi:AGCS family alanine or glycine:cation symporter
MLEQIGDWVNRLVWGPATLGALLLIGIYYTVRSRFFPFRRLRLWWKETAGSFFR